MNPPVILVQAGLASLAFATASQAETLAQYLFTSSTVATARVASTVGSNVTAGAFANGAGVTVSSSTLGSPDARSFYVNGNMVDQALSQTSNDWYGFTVSATSGNVLNLENLSFAYGYSYNSGTAPTTSATFDVRSSVDGYTSSLAVLTASVGAAPMAFDWSNASIVLTAPAFQGRDLIEFRIFLNDGANTNSSSFLRIDTVTLTGVSTVPSSVPEPSSYALLAGAGGLLLAGVRRRRRA